MYALKLHHLKCGLFVKPILPVTPVQPPLLINRKSKLKSEVDILTNTKNIKL